MADIRPSCCDPSIDGAEQDCVELVSRLLTHDSRTPLNAIVGFTELLLAGGSGQLGADARNWVAEIARAARDLEATLVAAGVLIELGLMPPRSEAGPAALGPLLHQAGFELCGGDGAAGEPIVLGTAGRWLGIFRAVHDYLARPVDTVARCRAAVMPAAEGLVLRLWVDPCPAELSDLDRVEIGLAARLAGAEGAGLSFAGRGDIRLNWPSSRLPAVAATFPLVAAIAR